MRLCRYKKFLFFSIGIFLFSGLVASILLSLGESISFFYSPVDALHVASADGEVRIGGTVKSLETSEKGIKFFLSDGVADVRVIYKGISPALMRNGIEAVGVGNLEDGVLYAKQVLIKHDERYYPQEEFNKLLR